jgi:two-component system chemotaxis response regulator CheY
MFHANPRCSAAVLLGIDIHASIEAPVCIAQGSHSKFPAVAQGVAKAHILPRQCTTSEGWMKALVVDSSNTMRSVLHRLLSMRGFVVGEADNCQQAMDVLRGMGTAHLVLVDWGPQQIDRLEFVARLRHELLEDTRVLMLVAAEPGIRELHGALIAGADDYLIKPFTSLQIDEKLAQVGLTWRL